MKSRHSLVKSFQFALEGVWVAFGKGRNFRIQVGAGVLALALGFILKLTPYEFVDLVLIISLVLILELLNTAIESMVDMVSPEIRVEAKIAKDVSAAAVFIASIGSIIIAAFIFLPKLLS